MKIFQPFLLLMLLLLFNGSTQKIWAQDLKELSLEDAVLRQWSVLRPSSLSSVSWQQDAKSISFVKEGKTLVKYNIKDKQETSILSVDDLNKALKLELSYFPSVRWTSDNSFYFRHKNHYYSYNTETKEAQDLVKFSPDAANVDFHAKSAKVAFTRGNNLFMADETDSEIQISKIGEGQDVVAGQAIARYEFGIGKGTFWSPKGNLLAFYQKNEEKVHDYPLLDISQTPGALNSIKYPMAGQESEFAQVGVYNPKDRRITYLRVKGERDQYLTNLAWGPEEKYIYLAVVNRAQNHMKLQKYNAKDGQLVSTLFEEKHDKYVEPEHPVWFLPNNPNEFLWLSERDGFMHIYRYNTEGKLLNQVTKGKFVVEEIMGLDASGKKVIFKGTDESGLNMYIYSADLNSAKLNQLTKDEGVHSASLSPDGSKLYDVYSNLNTPNVCQIINTKNGKQLAELVKSDNPLKEYKVSNTEILTLKAEDGTDLHARMIKPSDFDPAKKYPVLVYVYGGPHAQMVSNRWLAGAPLWMHYQAEKGYIIFTLDNRGSKNRGFEFENIIHRQLGTIEMEDQMVGVEYLKKQAFVDADRMAVHGWSFGGFMTISMMLRKAGTFKVGVAGGPVTDWKYYEIMYGERYMDTPEENPEGYKKARLMEYVENLEGDLLLIHGTVDDVVVMQHNLALVKAFVDAGILVDFFPYPGHPHNVRGKDRVHLMKKVLTYIDEKLGE
jgi:dipeptidyl-peptidase-4